MSAALFTFDSCASSFTSGQRIPMLRRLYLLVLAGATFLGASRTHADTPAFTSGGSTSNQPPNFTGTKGWSFYNSNPPLLITQLGVFDSGGDGLDNPHEVGLWSYNGTLLASATVPAGSLAPLYDGYRYVPISPVTIPRAANRFDPSTAFIVAGQYSLNDTDDLVTPIAVGDYALGIRGFTGEFPSSGWYGYGSDLPFPNQWTIPPTEGTLGTVFWEVNFQMTPVPEPSSVLLFLLGGGALLYVRRAFHH